MPRLTPPTNMTFFISLLLFVAALAAQLSPEFRGYVAALGPFWLAAIGYGVLLTGVLIRGV